MKEYIKSILCLFTFLSISIFPQSKDTLWIDGKELKLNGQFWKDVLNYYDRLPSRAEGIVRPEVYKLAHNTAGLYFSFFTNSTKIIISYKLFYENVSLSNMPSTAVNGSDLYVKKGESWIFLGNAPSYNGKDVKYGFTFTNESREMRQYILFLPLYNGVKDVRLGVEKKSDFKNDDTWQNNMPIVFYGTSITQGGCASRPGNCHTALLLRYYNLPIINLGFSGNGRMEPEVINFLNEINAKLFVIDCHKNMSPSEVRERMEPAIRKIHENHPNTPIVLIEETNPYDIYPTERGNITDSVYQKLRSEGFTNLYYIRGNDLLGRDTEGTVDLVHPNDLGFRRFADEIIKFFDRNKLLKN